MRRPVAEDIKQHRPSQRIIAVHQNIEDQMHEGAEPVTYEQRVRINEDDRQ